MFGMFGQKKEHKLQRPAFFSPMWAALRQGAKEFAQYLPAFRDNPQPVEEPGALGNPTIQTISVEHDTVKRNSSVFDRYNSGRQQEKQKDKGRGR